MKAYNIAIKRESHYYCQVVATNSEEALDIAKGLEEGASPTTKHETIEPVYIRQVPKEIPPSNEGKLHEFRQL